MRSISLVLSDSTVKYIIYLTKKKINLVVMKHEIIESDKEITA